MVSYTELTPKETIFLWENSYHPPFFVVDMLCFYQDEVFAYRITSSWCLN